MARSALATFIASRWGVITLILVAAAIVGGRALVVHAENVETERAISQYEQTASAPTAPPALQKTQAERLADLQRLEAKVPYSPSPEDRADAAERRASAAEWRAAEVEQRVDDLEARQRMDEMTRQP